MCIRDTFKTQDKRRIQSNENTARGSTAILLHTLSNWIKQIQYNHVSTATISVQTLQYYNHFSTATIISTAAKAHVTHS